MKSRGHYAIKIGPRTLKYRTPETYSKVLEALSHGRFQNLGQMIETAKQLPSGFEYVMSAKKEKELEHQFNNIEFDD